VWKVPVRGNEGVMDIGCITIPSARRPPSAKGFCDPELLVDLQGEKCFEGGWWPVVPDGSGIGRASEQLKGAFKGRVRHDSGIGPQDNKEEEETKR